MKLLLLPFRVVYHSLRLVFRLHWVIYLGLAFGAAYFASLEYQAYLSKRIMADVQIADGPPDAILLSNWNAVDAAAHNGEVTVQGIYFAALGQGEFRPLGLTRNFILLADDLGREVKAVLVALPEDMPRLQRQLAAQGKGDRIAVTVNGDLNTNSDWAGLIAAQLQGMNVPAAEELVIVEPFIGNRTMAIIQRTERVFETAIVLASLAGLFALLCLIRLLFGGRREVAKAAKPTHVTARGAKHLHEKPKPVGMPETSPWGTFQPTAPQPATAEQSKAATKAQKPDPARASQKDEPPPLPEFKSVFPGGGSGFRFKTADEIIRQSFGTLSTLTPTKPRK